MSDDDAPKSAVELAMEKLRASGFSETQLTDAQKAEIAEIRSRCRAKIAELEIHHEGKLRGIASFEEAQILQDELTKEKARLEVEMSQRGRRDSDSDGESEGGDDLPSNVDGGDGGRESVVDRDKPSDTKEPSDPEDGATLPCNSWESR